MSNRAKKGKKGERAQLPQSTSRKPATRQDVGELIDDLTDEQRAEFVQELVVRYHIKETFSGPLPTPEDFGKYNQILPGAADRILKMAEKQQQILSDDHDKIHANEAKRINGATLFSLALMVVASIAAWNGNSWIAIPFGLSGIIGVLLRRLFARPNKSK